MLDTLCPWLEEVGQVGNSEGVEVGIFAADDLLSRIGGISAEPAILDDAVDSRFGPSRAGRV
jgi:hypothetical protein